MPPSVTQLIITPATAYMCDFALINVHSSSRRWMDIEPAGADWTHNAVGQTWPCTQPATLGSFWRLLATYSGHRVVSQFA